MTNHPRSPINACPKHGETGNEPCLMCFPLMPKKDESPMEYSKRKYEGALKALSEQDAPTLTCSEVVERLPVCGKQMTWWNPGTGAIYCNEDAGHAGDCAYTFTQITPPDHSWRERRVQELEEALQFAVATGGLPHDAIGELKCTENCVRCMAERALANSEWREQIRKGAKHE